MSRHDEMVSDLTDSYISLYRKLEAELPNDERNGPMLGGGPCIEGNAHSWIVMKVRLSSWPGSVPETDCLTVGCPDCGKILTATFAAPMPRFQMDAQVRMGILDISSLNDKKP